MGDVMKNLVFATMLVFGISASAGAFACNGSQHGKTTSGTGAPATPAPAPAK
jgi:hypothetical protein